MLGADWGFDTFRGFFCDHIHPPPAMIPVTCSAEGVCETGLNQLTNYTIQAWIHI
jgi:hypothetical protein